MKEITIFHKDLKLRGILLNEEKKLAYCQDRLVLLSTTNGYYYILNSIDVHEVMPLMK